MASLTRLPERLKSLVGLGLVVGVLAWGLLLLEVMAVLLVVEESRLTEDFTFDNLLVFMWLYSLPLILTFGVVSPFLLRWHSRRGLFVVAFLVSLLGPTTTLAGPWLVGVLTRGEPQEMGYTPRLASDEFTLAQQERIGKLRLGLTEREVTKVLPCGFKRDAEELSPVDGRYHQSWVFADCGITLGMSSEDLAGQKFVDFIHAAAPATLETRRGIRIGSDAAEVTRAYGKDQDIDSSRSDRFVAGSIYLGLVFHYDNGRVSSIFLGPAAE